MQCVRCEDTTKHLRTTVTKISPALDLRGEQLRMLHFTLADFARVLVLYKNEAASFLLRRDDEDDAPSVDFYVLVTAREPKQLGNRQETIRGHFSSAFCGQLPEVAVLDWTRPLSRQLQRFLGLGDAFADQESLNRLIEGLQQQGS